MVQILRPRKVHQNLQAKEKMRIRPPRPLTAPFSTNLQIRQFLGSLQRLSHDINGSEQSDEHITIWPHPIGFANRTKRLNWTKDLPYLAEYSYFAECFRKKAPRRMWAGLFVTAIESWVGKKVLAEWHVWAAIISPEAPATGKKLLIYDCDGEDGDFGHCRAREALPLSIQCDFWRQKKMPFAELWHSSYDPETFGRNQCMKNTCHLLALLWDQMGSRFGQNSPEGKKKRARPKFRKWLYQYSTKSPFSRRIFHFGKARIIDLDGYGRHQRPSYGNG
ncbi:hypothetical protein B0H13DRAFT_1850741 [Mycena leptocephala]|nr:hypothetical protein B0H13DRAFT_1850741 [Mycena leptocephala]